MVFEFPKQPNPVKDLATCLRSSFEEKGLAAFVFQWEGTRVPTDVGFPEGVIRRVQYMRDGLLLFNDGISVVYERLHDIYPKQPQSIVIGYNKSDSSV